MKYILSFVGIGIICLAIFFCGGNNASAKALNEDYMRIHITANSNSVTDQNLKYKVKDAVVEFLIPKLAYAENKDEAAEIIALSLFDLQMVVNDILKSEGVEN